MSAPVTDARTKLERVLAEASASEHRDALGALVLGALSRQAEGRTLFVGPELADTMAAQSGIDAEKAQLESANVLALLKRGPSTEAEHLLLSALAVKGLGAVPEAERKAQLARFARHAVWLETSTPYEVFGFVDLALAEGDAATVWRAVADAVLADDVAGAAARARNAARISALCRSSASAASAEIDRLLADARDPATRALVAALSGRSVYDPHVVRGRLDRVPPRSGLRGAVRLFSGFALLQWVARFLAASVGFRADGEIALTSVGDVRLRATTSLLGRVIRDREETLPRSGLSRVGRYARFPALSLLVGALGLAVGIVVGGVVLIDGIRSGDTLLLLAGAGVVLAGGLCDLVATLVAAARRGEVSLFVEGPKRSICVSGIPTDEAERFLAAFSEPA